MISIARSSIFVAMLLACVPQAIGERLNGVWQSQGYGYVFEITDSSVNVFDVTATTCVFDFKARRDRIERPGREATFSTKDGDVYFIRAGGEADHKLLHNDGAASDLRIDRLPMMPKVCNPRTSNTLANNFEVFTRTFAEHYISFDLKKYIWDRIVANDREKLTARSGPAELFEMFQSMIKPLGDRHTFINAAKMMRRYQGIRPGTDRVVKGGFGAFEKKGMYELTGITDRVYLHGPLRKFCNNQIEYGHVDGTTGYVRIWSFAGYAKQSSFDGGRNALESALDQIFSDPNLKALVIDMRINFGGYDPWGLDIASRLATTEYLAYTKYARADSADRNKWTEGDPNVIHPTSRRGFHGPVGRTDRATDDQRR